VNTLAVKILPVLLIFALGIILRRINLFTEENADSFQKLVFYVALPASILVSITKIKLSLNVIYLPITAAVIIIISFFAASMVGRFFNLSRPAFGVFLVGSMIMNTGFTFPFFIAVYGQEGFARASLFDFGNGLLVLTFVYYIAVKYGSNEGPKVLLKKLMTSSPLWALFAALIMNLTHIELPVVLNDLFKILGDMLTPLFMLSLGIYFNLRILNLKAVIAGIALRMFLGLLLGFIFVNLFKINGLDRQIVLISSSAPVGFNTLTFATMENLDKEFAASLVSNSILLGIIFTPLLIFFLS